MAFLLVITSTERVEDLHVLATTSPCNVGGQMALVVKPRAPAHGHVAETVCFLLYLVHILR